MAVSTFVKSLPVNSARSAAVTRRPNTFVVSSAATEPSTSSSSSEKVVTIEYQRQRAKAMTKYFNEKKQAKIIEDSKVLGWTVQNEIGNGRWVMMGLLIGMLTEFATGVDFVDQIKLMITNLSIADLD